MLHRLGLATAVVLALYLLVTLIRGAPGNETGATQPVPPNKGLSAQTMASKQVDIETRRLLAELRTIPVSEYAVNLVKYKRLLELHPGDIEFTCKVAFYTQKLAERRGALDY